MKHLKKIVSLLLTAIMVVAMCIPVMADATTHSIIIKGSATGHTYEAYKIFKGDVANNVLSNPDWGDDIDGDALINRLKADKTIGSDFTDVSNVKSVIEKIASYTDDDLKIQAFAKVVGKYLKENKQISATQKSQESNAVYTISGLTAGYYLVKDKEDSFNAESDASYSRYMLNLVNSDINITAKDTKPTLDKQIKHNDDGTWGIVGDNQIGDTVEFRTTTTVPNTVGYTKYNYVITDTMSPELTSNVVDGNTNNTVSIKINDDAVLAANYYTVTVDGKTPNTFEVRVNILQAITDGVLKAGQTLYTYYTGVLNERAKMYFGGPQENKAQLIYSNNPNDEDDCGKTPEKKVYDWTFTMDVHKVDKDNPNTELAGAKFVLSKKNNLTITMDENGNLSGDTTDLIKLVKNENVYTVADTTTNTTYIMTSTGDQNKPIKIKGLDDYSEYYLYEVKAPDGYHLRSTPFTFKIDAAYELDGEHLKTGYPTAVIEGKQSSNGLSATIENSKGSQLPSTGGIGTTIFYVVGVVLMLGAGVLLITKRRMSAKH